MTAEQRTSLFNALMMSTAVPVQDENGIPYSPRKQGAGLVQLQNAMKSDVFLLNSDNSRPKAEIGYNENGNFSFKLLYTSENDKDVINNTSVKTGFEKFEILCLAAVILISFVIYIASSIYKNKLR